MTMGDKVESTPGNFFSQLRRLVSVEKQISKLQTEVLQPQTTDGPQDGGAVLLLRGLEDDLKQHLRSGRRHLANLCSDDGFQQLVPKCKVVLEHQAVVIQQITEYLTQYGYKTPQQNDPAENINAGAGLNTVPATPLQIQVDQDPECQNNVPAATTPVNVEKPPTLDPEKTPTMEAFGISAERIVAHLGKTSTFKQPTIPEAPEQGSSQRWPSSESIPDQFKHDGICVTPGFFNGRPINTLTPKYAGMNAHHRFPRRGQSPDKMMDPKQKLWAGLENEDPDLTIECQIKPNQKPENCPRQKPNPPMLSTAGLKPLKKTLKQPNKYVAPRKPTLVEDSSLENSPIPPMMTTPGVKQIMKHSLTSTKFTSGDGESSTDCSPVPPVLTTPGVKQIMKHSLTSTKFASGDGESSTDCSPVPPVLTTPGVKQVKPGFSKESTLQSGESSKDNSPIPPVLNTPGLKQFHKKTTQLCSNDPIHRDRAEYIPEFPELTKDVDVALTTVPSPPRLISKEFDLDDDIPDMPELTYKFNTFISNPIPPSKKETTTVSPQCSTEPEGTATTVSKKDAVKSTIYLGDTDNEDVPPMPEFTYKFNYTTVPHTSSDGTTLTSSSPENASEVIPSQTEEYTGPCLAAITEEEYANQPDYIQKSQPLRQINAAIKNLNRLLATKAKEGRPAELEMSDFQDQVGQKAGAMVLVMTRLGRLQSARSKAGRHAYRVV